MPQTRRSHIQKNALSKGPSPSPSSIPQTSTAPQSCSYIHQTPLLPQRTAREKPCKYIQEMPTSTQIRPRLFSGRVRTTASSATNQSARNIQDTRARHRWIRPLRDALTNNYQRIKSSVSARRAEVSRLAAVKVSAPCATREQSPLAPSATNPPEGISGKGRPDQSLRRSPNRPRASR
jgi:hypothetical protein